jgi:leader peptidase (prepilin peptidase)/N-methyltransferase
LAAWFLLGACIGSFLNVCIYRLPKDLSICKPARSFCPSCERTIAWHDNIPLLSFALLRATCRHCAKPIRWRYPIVELLTAALTAAVVWRFGVWPVGAVYLAFVWSLIVVSFIDLEYKLIPNIISIGGLLVGIVVSLFVPQLHGTQDWILGLARSVFGAMIGCSILYLTGSIGTFLFQKEAMGLGDVDLLAMAGAFLGWKLVTLTFFMAPVLALIPGLLVLVRKQSHEIPYGPYLSLALLVSMFAGNRIIAWTGVEQAVQTLIMAFGWPS